MEKIPRKYLQEIGRKGGRARTAAKRKAARENGRKGGRPPVLRVALEGLNTPEGREAFLREIPRFGLVSEPLPPNLDIFELSQMAQSGLYSLQVLLDKLAILRDEMLRLYAQKSL